MNRISVIVPVYKVEPYIHRCVDSILAQSYGDFELILVDDGSPDNCGAICDEYAQKDKRIHVIHQENGGLSAARNAGMDWVYANSHSQWLAFIDSDDWIHRDYLKILLTSALEFEAKMSVCDMKRTEAFCNDVKLQKLKVRCLDSESAYSDYYGMCLAAWRKLYHRDLFETLRFPVGKLHEDAYITHIPLFAAEKVAVCDVPLYYYFTNPSSITRIKWSDRRLQEIEAHEIRAAWLKEHGYEAAYKREIEVYVMTIYEQTEVLARLSKDEQEYLPHLQKLRKKLKNELKKARKIGLFPLEREYMWIYLMAYPLFPLWSLGQRLRNKRNRRLATE